MSFRHKLRKLFLSQCIEINEDNDEKEEDIFDILINKIGVKFDHSKPNNIMINQQNESDEKVSSILDVFDAKKEVKLKLAQCNEQTNLFSIFTEACTELLIEESYKNNPFLIKSLLRFNSNIISISNRIDLCKLLLKHDSSVQFRNLCLNFTLHQLIELSDEFPKLWEKETFLMLYLGKLMPLELSFYLGTNVYSDLMESDIPLHLLSKCFEIILTFVLTHEKCQLLPITKANILANYLSFRVQQCKQFDFEVFMEYLHIPKNSHYNVELRKDVLNQTDIDVNNDNDKGALCLINNDNKVSLLSEKWTMFYNYDIDYMIVDEYLMYYIKNENSNWNKAIIINNDLRFNSKWLQRWIATNKNNKMEESLQEFVDKRYLKILKLRYLLSKDKNNKKTIEYMNELKQLIEDAPIP
eukprot:210710_1